MTREEATKIIKDYEVNGCGYCHQGGDEVEEAFKIAIEALEQELSEDCISRKEVCDYIAEFVNHEYATDRERELVKHIIGGIQHLPSIQPTAKENLVVGDCMKREFIEIVVEYPPADLCTYPEYKGKPYYSILYRDEDSRNHVGFGTYKIEMLSQWIKQYFMSDIQPKPKTEWIPVSERLPEEFQRVLVTIVNYKGDKVVRVAEYYNRKGVFQIKENHEQWEVGEKGLLAWMPLPEPYEAEKE